MVEPLTNRKLLSLKRCIDRVKITLPASASALNADIDAQDIISLNLQRAVQLCVDLAYSQIANAKLKVPDTMAAAFATLGDADLLPDDVVASMQSAVGFRNLSVHQYDEVDWDIVYAICTKHLADFQRFAAALQT